MQCGLTRADTDSLDEYLQSIRDIEIRVAREERWLTIPKPRVPKLKAPDNGLRGIAEINLMDDLAIAALQTDSTRVITYRQPVQTLLNSTRLSIDSHAITHPSPGPLLDTAIARDKQQLELLAGLIDRLLAMTEPDGSSLFDHTTIVFGENTRTAHALDNCPAIIAGAGAGLRLGQQFNDLIKPSLQSLVVATSRFRPEHARSWRLNGTARRPDGLIPNRNRHPLFTGAPLSASGEIEYRIRILRKSAIVGTPNWIEFFQQHQHRFVVGRSIGTRDDQFGSRLEVGASVPSARIRVMHTLQEAGVPTFGMLCPVFPEVLEGDKLEGLMDAIRLDKCENVWAEPDNDRQNWRYVRECFETNSPMWNWMTQVYEQHNWALWSKYTTDLFECIRDRALRDNWIDRLDYLLYEKLITDADADRFQNLNGVLLQAKQNDNGLSCHPKFAMLQTRTLAK